MPHSSGGGSHGGGFHSGGGGSRHGGSGGGGIRVARKYFPGAKRYMYYHHGSPRYVYTSKPLTPQTTGMMIVQMVFFVPFIIIGLFLLVTGIGEFFPPRPLVQTAAYEQYHIEDTLDVIDNETELEAVLQQFQDKTGICPYIVTVDTSIWKNKFPSLEKYAYDTYIRKFSDEKHFLIVYSAPINSDPENASDWSWEGMQGDSTDPILSTRNMEKFNRRLYYTLESGEPVGSALYQTFDESLDYLMKAGSSIVDGLIFIGFAVIWLLIIGFVFVKSIKDFILSRKNLIEVPLENSQTEIKQDFLDV